MDGDAFSATVLEKLPLADSVWQLLHFTMDDAWLQDLWTRKRGRCYERDLGFSTLAHLIADALLEHGGSGRQAFERGQEAKRLRVSIASSYEKLGHLPVPVSETLLEEGTQRMQQGNLAGIATHDAADGRAQEVTPDGDMRVPAQP